MISCNGIASGHHADAAGALTPFTNILRGHPKRKDKLPIDWTPELLELYDQAKSKLLVTTALAFPDSTAQLPLTTDASDFAIGAVLEQLSPGETDWRPASFTSKRLTSAQENWCTYDKEHFAIAEAIEKCCNPGCFV